MVILDKVKTSTGNEPVGVTYDAEGNVIHETYATKEELEGVEGGGTSITIDPTPTSGSNNAVSSGGVYGALTAYLTKEKAEMTYVTQLELPVAITERLMTVYPVGSIYMSTVYKSPGSFIGGTWTEIGQGRVLMGAGKLNDITYTAGAPVDAGLPNIEGAFEVRATSDGGQALINPSGVFVASTGTSGNSLTRSTTAKTSRIITFDASTSSAVYGNSTTVQPNAYVVYMWERTN